MKNVPLFYVDVYTKSRHILRIATIPAGMKIVDVPVTAYSEIAQTIEKYADHEIDFTEATLIWLVNSSKTGVSDKLKTSF
jgi:hypothetical protein